MQGTSNNDPAPPSTRRQGVADPLRSLQDFRTRLQQLNDQTKSVKNVLEYRIALASGATGGYTRAVQILAIYILKPERAGFVLAMALDHLAEGGHPLPTKFILEVLEEVLALWEDDSGMFSDLGNLVGYSTCFASAIYTGSVLLATRRLTEYYPTVASWHAVQQAEPAVLTDHGPTELPGSRLHHLLQG